MRRLYFWKVWSHGNSPDFEVVSLYSYISFYLTDKYICLSFVTRPFLSSISIQKQMWEEVKNVESIYEKKKICKNLLAYFLLEILAIVYQFVTLIKVDEWLHLAKRNLTGWSLDHSMKGGKTKEEMLVDIETFWKKLIYQETNWQKQKGLWGIFRVPPFFFFFSFLRRYYYLSQPDMESVVPRTLNLISKYLAFFFWASNQLPSHEMEISY